MRWLGGEYEFHTIAMRLVHANFKNVEEVVSSIKAKKLTTTYVNEEWDSKYFSAVENVCPTQCDYKPE
jgi:hypothetical protein